MIQVLWEFVVRPSALREFERAYGPAGKWARLFKRYRGYGGSSLLRDVDNPRRFLTIDRWESAEQRSLMLSEARAEYARLDEECGAWTESETEVGTFSTGG